ncbi:MAG: LptF/LptG family permease [Candidatus Coatesbacteria bacterium]
MKIGRPRIIMRYLHTEFIRNFLLALFGLTILILIGNLFDELARLTRQDPPAWAVAAYFVLRVPYLLAQAMPLAVLIGTLFTLTSMLRSHELIAMRAGGVDQWALAWPILAPALVVSLGMIAFDETVVPWANSRSAEIKRVHIRKQPLHELEVVNRAAVWTVDGKLVYAEQANGEEGLLHRVTIAEIYGRKLLGRVDAESARPERGAWVLTKALVCRWRKDEMDTRRVRRAVYPLAETMGNFLRDERELKEQSMRELRDNIRKLRQAGRDYSSERVFYHLKWAFPFASVIVALLALGISFTFQTNPREGVAASVTVAILSAIAYIFLVQFGQVLGMGGVLPPVISMWMANVVFFVAGVILLWRAWRW